MTVPVFQSFKALVTHAFVFSKLLNIAGRSERVEPSGVIIQT